MMNPNEALKGILEEVEEIPSGRGSVKKTLVDDIIKNVTEAPIAEGKKVQYFCLTIPDKTPKQTVSLFYEKVKQYNLNKENKYTLQVCTRTTKKDGAQKAYMIRTIRNP